MSKKRAVVYDGKMDAACIRLCDALNKVPGIHTTESCCGHGKQNFVVFFSALTLESLRPILAELDSGNRWPWDVKAYRWSGSGTIGFCLEGPVGTTKQDAELLGKKILARLTESA